MARKYRQGNIVVIPSVGSPRLQAGVSEANTRNPYAREDVTRP